MTMPRALRALGPVVNPLLLPLARRLPPLAVLHHVGRRTGRRYETPVQAFPTGDGYLIGLVYDSRAEWARNLLRAGGGELTRAGRTYPMIMPTRVTGPDARNRLPRWAAIMMRLVGVDEFVALQLAS